MSDPEQEQRIAEAYTGRADHTARPVTVESADLLSRIAARLDDELDTADLVVAGGDTVQIVCVSEVRGWLQGLAIRARAGAPL